MTKQNFESWEDHKLLSHYKSSSDGLALAILFKRYLPLIFGLCMKYFKNKEDSEDATMSIYELISKKLNSQDIGNFKSWIYVVSKNYCLEDLRKRQHTLTKEKDYFIMQSASFFHPDEVKDDAIFEKLEKCIELLPTKQKQMIQLFYFEKKAYQEIVDQVKLEWKEVRSNIQNGRRNLKNCLEK